MCSQHRDEGPRLVVDAVPVTTVRHRVARVLEDSGVIGERSEMAEIHVGWLGGREPGRLSGRSRPGLRSALGSDLGEEREILPRDLRRGHLATIPLSVTPQVARDEDLPTGSKRG